MKSICIKTNNPSILDYLLKKFSKIDLDSVYLSTNTFKLYNNIILHYTGNCVSKFFEYVAEILSHCTITFYEKKFIKSMMNYDYFYFSDREKQEITENCMDLLLSDSTLYREKFNSLYQAFLTYLQEHHNLVLTGVINFRLKDYRDFLNENLALSVSNFLIEKEYYEFISILHLYVNSKPSQIEHVHLVYVNKESILIDDDKNIIDTDDSLFKATYLSDITFSSNDYCLNTLLTILPQKLTIHLINDPEDEFITTLKLIFEDRVSICTDCDICHVYKLTNTFLMKEEKLPK